MHTIIISEGLIVGAVMTGQSLTKDEAIRLAGIDLDEMSDPNTPRWDYNEITTLNVTDEQYRAIKAGTTAIFGLDVYDFEPAVTYMDDGIREVVHARLAPCSNQAFASAYASAHEEKYGEPFEVN